MTGVALRHCGPRIAGCSLQTMPIHRGLAALGAVAMLVPALAAAQQPARRWERPGFDFSANGVWRQRARQVRQAREAALLRGDLATLNAPLRGAAFLNAAGGTPRPSPMAVSGTLYAPALLVVPKNLSAAGPFPAAQYDALLFGATPPAGRPYSLRTFYEQMSINLLSVRGQAVGWIVLDSNDTWYEGNCNGLCAGGTSGGHVPQLILEAVQKSDAAVDFGQFDNDGPDGIPNSPDDDGRVDLAILIQPEVGGECVNLVSAAATNLWSHRFSYSGWTGSTVATSDPRRDALGNPIAGQFIRVDDYTIQPGVGGANACTASDLMPIGTIAHETGHGFGLPDLYDVHPSDGDDSEGIGEWGLMSSGNYARPNSPAHMEGWSRLQLGWVNVRDVTTSGTYGLGAYTVSDSILRIVPTSANPRAEYFLVENRQAQEGDTALIGKGKGPGLLVYHLDGAKITSGSFSNSVNSGSIHGVWVLQADGLNQLRSSVPAVRNRGDAGDPFPGTAGSVALGYGTNPSIRLNDGAGTFPGFAIDSIRQVVTDGEMRLRVLFGALTVVRASDTSASIRFRGANTQVVRDLFGAGDTGTVDIDSAQLSDDGRTQFLFQSWSDGLPRTHLATFSPAGDSLIASLARRFRVNYLAVGGGTVGASGGVASGTFIADGDSVTLTAVSGPAQSFVGWTGDTVTASPVLLLRLGRPYSVVATFQAQLAVADTVLRVPVMGAPYADTIRMSGGSGTYVYTRVAGTVPPGLVLSNQGVLSGIPTHDSTYTFTVRAASAGQQLDLPLTMGVTAPALEAAAVVDQLLAGGAALTADERRYMDLQGNVNGGYDIGDVTAWFDGHPGLLSPDLLRRLARRAAR
jgi:M6 family metalloprotease-like protein